MKDINMKIRVAMEELRYQWNKQCERAAMAIAWAMPKWLVKWCAVRVFAHATTGEYSSQVVPELTFSTALQRWS